MKNVKRGLLLLACVLSAAWAQERVTSVEGITEYRFPNGLRLLLFPDPSKPTITENVIYLAGSRHENYGETGMSHMIEHVVSYGSPKHPDVRQEQAARGARRNAITWFDRANYFEIFPASEANLEWELDLEEIRAGKSGWLQAQQVSRSQDVELVRRLRLHRHYSRTMAYDAELEKEVGALTADQIVTALRRHLDPAQISIILAGDFRTQ